MPGVLIVEAMAQVGAVALLSLEENRGKIAFFAGIDKVRFKRQVGRARRCASRSRITKSRGPIGFGEATAYGRRRARVLRRADVCDTIVALGEQDGSGAIRVCDLLSTATITILRGDDDT